MNLSVKRIPFKQNTRFLTDYWGNHIKNWQISSRDILYFSQEASDNLWLYLTYVDQICCGILVNEEQTDSTLWLLHVLPEFRNQGIGTALYLSAKQQVKGKWIAGSGNGYWWQGVPEGYGDDFLQRRGFNWSWTSVDMVLPLDEQKHLNTLTNCEITILNPLESKQLLRMIESEADLSNWSVYYQQMIDNLEHNKILVARIDGLIVGAAMILEENSIRWRRHINGKVGGVGCIGVSSSYREHGIGSSLVNAVHSQLKSLGYTHCYVGYTWLEEWYQRMGYHVFSKQKMGYQLVKSPLE